MSSAKTNGKKAKTKIGESYKRYKKTNEKFDVIVIGSGIGGLACAALLSKHGGKKVLVLERHYTAGGYTHVFTRPGYEWDVGVHYIGDVSHPLTDVRVAFDDITDGKLAWSDNGEIYDSIILAGKRYDFVKGADNFRAKMKEYFPNDGEAIDRYVDLIRHVVKQGRFYFAEKALPALPAKLLGKRMRKPLLDYAQRTVWDVMHEITDNEELIAVLIGQFGDYGLPPKQASFAIQAMVANHYLDGAGYPVGGSARIAETIVEGLEERGCRVLISAEVDEVIVEGNRAKGVKMMDGREFRAPTIISDAGAYTTYQKLLPKEWADKINIAEKLKSYGRSPAHISIYIGLEGTDEELGLEKGNLWVYPGADHDANVERFLEEKYDAPLPVAYISFPSAKDPDFQNRYPGHSTIQVITVAPYEWFAKWQDKPWQKRGKDYDALKEKLTKKLLDALYQQCPQIKGKVKVTELSTPLSTRHFCNYEEGEIYGVNHTPERFEDTFLRVHTPIKGFYLTGQDICTAGVAGALAGGVITSTVLLAGGDFKNKLKRLDLKGIMADLDLFGKLRKIQKERIGYKRK